LLHLTDGFPIYALDQLPAVPYEVQGFIYTTSTSRSTSQADELEVVKQARLKGGQAALITRQPSPSADGVLVQTDYLIVRFATNSLASVLDRINVYMALHPESRGHEGEQPSPAQLEALKQAIQRHSQPR
jgi:hypothetical protein